MYTLITFLFLNFLSISMVGQLGKINIKSSKELKDKIKAQGKIYCSPKGCDPVNKIIINTGINSSGSVLPVSSVDPNWDLVNMPPVDGAYHSSTIIPRMHIIGAYSGSSTWNVIPGTGILSPAAVANFGPNNSFRSQPWRLRNYFCVCKKDKVCFTGQFKADDQATALMTRHSREGFALAKV